MSRRTNTSHPFSLFAFQDIITSVTGIMILVTLLLAVELMQRKESSPQTRTEDMLQQLAQQLVETERTIAELNDELQIQSAQLEGAAVLDEATLRTKASQLDDRMSQLQTDLASLKRQERDTRQRLAEAQLHKQQQNVDPDTIKEMRQQVVQIQSQLSQLKSSNRMVYNPGDNPSAKTAWLVEITGGVISVAQMGHSATPRSFHSSQAFERWLSTQNPDTVSFLLIVKPDAVDSFHDTLDELRGRNFQVGFDLVPADQEVLDPVTGAGV